LTGTHPIATNAPVIVLLSDGHHNESEPGELLAVADRVKAAGIRIISIGLGEEADADQLRDRK
jgi:Mg-chelatase subunit ChlD